MSVERKKSLRKQLQVAYLMKKWSPNISFKLLCVQYFLQTSPEVGGRLPLSAPFALDMSTECQILQAILPHFASKKFQLFFCQH